MNQMNKNNLKINKNIISGNMHYSIFQNSDEIDEIVASSNKEVVDYRSFKSAYNPNYAYTDIIIQIPEDILYPNSRHHRKFLYIIDGKFNNGFNEVLGFLLSTRSSRHNTILELEPIRQYAVKRVIHKDIYDRSIKLELNSISNRRLSLEAKQKIKRLSTTQYNIRVSRNFR